MRQKYAKTPLLPASCISKGDLIIIFWLHVQSLVYPNAISVGYKCMSIQVPIE